MNPAFPTYGTNAPSDDDLLLAAERFGCEPCEVSDDQLAIYLDECRENWCERE